MRGCAKHLVTGFILLNSAGIGHVWAQSGGLAINTWTPTADMATPRAAACSVLLPDGRVLVSGGDGANGAVNQVELYATDGAFTAAAPMAQARSGAACAVMTDGRVFMSGGSAAGSALDTAEIFDPASGEWSSAGSMSSARTGHTATVTPWGAVLLVGGDSGGIVELYRPSINRFLTVGQLSSPRTDYAIAVLPNQKLVVIAGGSKGSLTLDSVDIYDGSRDMIVPGGTMAVARRNFIAAPLLDGTVLFAGGYSNDGTALASAEIFDPGAGTSLPGPDMTQARAEHRGYTLPNNGAVLLIGGTNGRDMLTSSEVYTPWTGKFTTTGSLHTARTSETASILRRGGLLVAGGRNGGAYLAGGEIYRFATIETDKPDYQPGDVATISGTGWKPGESVQIQVQAFPIDQHQVEFTAAAVADAAGRIQVIGFNIDRSHLGARFLLNATGSRSQAQTLFTDANTTITTMNPGFPNPASPANYGAAGIAVEFQGTVTSLSPPVDPSTITVAVDTVTVAPASLSAGSFTVAVTAGVGSFDFTLAAGFLTPGTHSVVITYNGAGNSSTSMTALSYTLHAPPIITVTFSPTSPADGQDVTVTATATAVAGHLPTGLGTLFVDNASVPPSQSPVNGVWTLHFTASLILPNPHSVGVSTAGDAFFFGQNYTVNEVPFNVTPDATTTTVNTSPANTTTINLGGSVTFVATVTNTSVSANNPQGGVTFFDNGTSINALCSGGAPTALTNANPALSSCTVTYTGAAPLSSGPHAITAVYASSVSGISGSNSNGVPYNLTVINPATHFAVSAPATATAGTSFNFTVTALDQFNNPTTGYAGTVHFTSSDGAATLPVNSTLTNGAGTFSATLKTVGAQTITATDTVTASITGTSNAIAVSAGASVHFTVSAPASATAGTSFNFTVTALDQFNNTLTGYSGTVHFTSSDAQATLPANSTLTNGVGTFSATLKTAGARTITATDTVTASITGTSIISVSPGVATHFTLSAPATATSGAGFSFTVTAVDQFGNTATGYAGTVGFGSSDGGATLPANTTLTNGTGTFTATLRTPGNQTISATATAAPFITGTSGIQVGTAQATNGTASPTSLNFQYYLGTDSSGLTANVSVDSATGSTFTVASPAPWLTVSGGSRTTPATVSVTANPAGLTAGNYQTLLIFTFSDGNTATVSVQLRVTAIQLQATPSPLSFTAQAGATSAQTATLIVIALGKNVPVTLSVTGGAWLSGTASAPSTPFTVQVEVSPAGLAAGTYSGSIVLTSAPATNSPLSVPVTLTVAQPPPALPAISVAAIVNAASMQPGPAAPNTIVSAFGTFPGCNSVAQVTIDSNATSVFASTPTQINFLVPASVSGETAASVQIACAGLTSQTTTLPIATVDPAIFTAAMTGTGQAAIVNQDGSIDKISTAGNYLQVYTTGFGLLAAPGADGLAHLTLTVTASIGGAPATVLYAGEAPGWTHGLQQINVLIPANASKGPSVPLVLTVGGVTTQTGVTLGIQ